MQNNVDCGQPYENTTYDLDSSLYNLSCMSFPKGCFHDPVASTLR